MQLPTLEQIHEAQALVYRYMPPTPQYSWPLVNERFGKPFEACNEQPGNQKSGAEVWIKHENHTPIGAFKLRGALVYMSWLKQNQPDAKGVIAATRGNFGQGVGMAARLFGFPAVIVVPHGNSIEKNRAMLAQRVELLEHGEDFQESFEFACEVAQERGMILVDSFHELLVWGTATYALELFQGAPPLDVVYVPIGMGSSICGMAAARNALGLATEIVGVTAADSPSSALSFRERRLVEAPARTRIADGLACRKPHVEALQVFWENVARIVEVTDGEIEAAMRACFEDTHNLAEGAGAAAFAAALKEADLLAGKRAGIVFSGGNIDRQTYAVVLGGAARPARIA